MPCSMPCDTMTYFYTSAFTFERFRAATLYNAPLFATDNVTQAKP